ncbi:MAG: cytochrome ubiquinol oxidase subunit I [Elusimicrobiota bacterium]
MVTPAVFKGVGKGLMKVAAIFAAIFLIYKIGNALLDPAEYRVFPVIGSRVFIWIFAQLHLMFAAFVLGVPMFAVIAEIIGIATKDKRYDNLAHEMTKLIALAFTVTAVLGAIFLLGLLFLYPMFFERLTEIFKPTYYIYLAAAFGEVVYAYLYYYSWDHLQSPRGMKWLHVFCGIMLNVFGTAIMFAADSWASFMLSPEGVTAGGQVVSLAKAAMNLTWMPINIHRLLGNVAFGGFVVGAYAAVRFLTSETAAEKKHYDWMGYVGNFIGIIGMIPLPFAGYWLSKEIYAFNQTMGISMMGGIFSWLFIIQAILIAMLFIAGNYYLWIAMQRIPGGERHQASIKYLVAVIFACFAIWMTPHTIPLSAKETALIGGAHHPLVGIFGVMSAKMTAVNIAILATFMSFMMYYSANKQMEGSGAAVGKYIVRAVYLAAAALVVYIGVKGYYVSSEIRVERLSPMQVGVVLGAMFLVLATTLITERVAKARTLGEIRWGEMPDRSQYALILMAVTITLLMGLMGYLRSALRQNYHFYAVLKDTSADAFTPTLGYASNVIAVTVLIFYALVIGIFWLGLRGEKKSGAAALTNSDAALPHDDARSPA